MGCLKVRNIILLDCPLILSRCRGILEQKKKSGPNRGRPLNNSIEDGQFSHLQLSPINDIMKAGHKDSAPIKGMITKKGKVCTKNT